MPTLSLYLLYWIAKQTAKDIKGIENENEYERKDRKKWDVEEGREFRFMDIKEKFQEWLKPEKGGKIDYSPSAVLRYMVNRGWLRRRKVSHKEVWYSTTSSGRRMVKHMIDIGVFKEKGAFDGIQDD